LEWFTISKGKLAATTTDIQSKGKNIIHARRPVKITNNVTEKNRLSIVEMTFRMNLAQDMFLNRQRRLLT